MKENTVSRKDFLKLTGVATAGGSEDVRRDGRGHQGLTGRERRSL